MRAEPEREEAAMASTYSVPLSELVSEFDLNFFYKSSDYEKIHVTVDDVSRPGCLNLAACNPAGFCCHKAIFAICYGIAAGRLALHAPSEYLSMLYSFWK